MDLTEKHPIWCQASVSRSIEPVRWVGMWRAWTVGPHGDPSHGLIHFVYPHGFLNQFWGLNLPSKNWRPDFFWGIPVGCIKAYSFWIMGYKLIKLRNLDWQTVVNGITNGNQCSKPLTRPAISGGGRMSILKCTPPKFSSLPLKNDGLKFEDYIYFPFGSR